MNWDAPVDVWQVDGTTEKFDSVQKVVEEIIAHAIATRHSEKIGLIAAAAAAEIRSTFEQLGINDPSSHQHEWWWIGATDGSSGQRVCACGAQFEPHVFDGEDA